MDADSLAALRDQGADDFVSAFPTCALCEKGYCGGCQGNKCRCGDCGGADSERYDPYDAPTSEWDAARRIKDGA